MGGKNFLQRKVPFLYSSVQSFFMKSRILTLVLFLCLATVKAENTLTQTDSSDPFDLSKSESKLNELGIPTLTTVDALERNASTLYQKQDWKAASEANAEFARAANWLANIIESGLRPFYKASYDDKKSFLQTGAVTDLAPYESQMNDLRKKRNRALVIQAECELNLGNKKQAVALLINALNVISVKEIEYWGKARELLYSQIEVK